MDEQKQAAAEVAEQDQTVVDPKETPTEAAEEAGVEEAEAGEEETEEATGE